jgi:hypothetical protein
VAAELRAASGGELSAEQAATIRLNDEHLRRATTAAPPAPYDLAGILLAGDNVPEDLGQRAVEAQRAVEYQRAEQEAFAEARSYLRGELDRVLVEGVDHGLRALRDDSIACSPKLGSWRSLPLSSLTWTPSRRSTSALQRSGDASVSSPTGSARSGPPSEG